jgi:alkylation response protein AidB-like acyl-CoA dehydrogenase
MGTTLAEADASTGWTCGHGAVCSALVANIAEPGFVEKVFADPMSSIAWSNLPRITAREAADGLRIEGSWSFVTGCLAATHVGGIVRLPGSEDRKPRVVVALAPAEEAEIEQTWDPVGLGGTGSHDVVFRDVFVPWERIFEWPDSRPRVDLPTAVFVPGTWFISMCAAATHLGLARRALDEVRRELDGKKDRYTQLPILEEQAVLRSLEEAEGLFYAYRAGVRQALATIWEAGLAGHPASIGMKMDARLACVTAVQHGEKIVRTAFGLAGAAAVARAGVLQRLVRDSSCLIHHVSANPKSLDEVGRCRIGAIAPEDAYI